MKLFAVLITAFMLLSSGCKAQDAYSNDLAYLFDMSEELLPNILDDIGEVKYDGTRTIYAAKYTIDEAITLYVDDDIFDSGSRAVKEICIDYSKVKDVSSISLMGIDGTDTFESFIERFGEEHCYPTGEKWYKKDSDDPIRDDACSINFRGTKFNHPNFSPQVYDGPFLTTRFDENGKMKSLLMGYGI